jgi:hypothetical protein
MLLMKSELFEVKVKVRLIETSDSPSIIYIRWVEMR